uniref:KRAB-related domain-containing protein n=1 Tax=Neovison vison TaxID=452646 RepID=A0A8C7AQE7_NEOVI
MNKGSSFAKNSKEDTQKSEKKCKAFKDISKYFSKEEWAKLGYSDKITYVYMKRNYDTMTSLGNRKATLPAFMCPKKRAMKSNGRDSDDDQNENQGESKERSQKRKFQLAFGVYQCGSNISASRSQNMGKTGYVEYLCALGKEQASPYLGKQRLTLPRSRKLMNSVWAYRLRERKTLIVYEEISDPEEDD